MKQDAIAEKLGVTRAQITNVEAGRVPLRLGLGWAACKLFDVHPGWLLTGHFGPEGERPFPVQNTPWFNHVEKLVDASKDAHFSEGYAALSWLLGPDAPASNVPTEETQKIPVDNYTKRDIMPPVKRQIPTVQELMSLVAKLTNERGQRTSLAKHLGVRPQQLNEWLVGRKEPNGQTTLQLLNWVQAEEEKQKTLGSVTSTTKGNWTRPKKSDHENPETSPP